jgi:hypothetical protein
MVVQGSPTQAPSWQRWPLPQLPGQAFTQVPARQ